MGYVGIQVLSDVALRLRLIGEERWILAKKCEILKKYLKPFKFLPQNYLK